LWRISVVTTLLALPTTTCGGLVGVCKAKEGGSYTYPPQVVACKAKRVVTTLILHKLVYVKPKRLQQLVED
jgi:hypothetical protein